MKWNWGTGIFIVIVIFLVACAVFLYWSANQHWNMVEEDYYPKELRHEEKLVKMRNANGLTGKMLVILDNHQVAIQFPVDFKGKELSGNLQVYRPSDETKDIILPVAVDTARSMYIPLNRFVRGKYVVKADWVSEGKAYYQESVLFIP